MAYAFVQDDIVANIVEAAPEVANEMGLVRLVEDAGIGWSYRNGKFEPPPAPSEPVPSTVTMRQAKIQLSRAGLLAKANAAIEAMEGQAGEEARLEWEYATELRRDHPLVAGIGHALGLDDAAKDDLFRQAAAIP